MDAVWKQRILIVLGILAASIADLPHPALGQDFIAPYASGGPRNPEISKTAERWLELLDGEQYDQAWQEVSKFLKTGVIRDDFVRAVGGRRAPFGMKNSRTFWGEGYRTTLRGRPDGQYYVIIFNTTFEKKPAGSFEQVILERENTEWKVTDYRIR